MPQQNEQAFIRDLRFNADQGQVSFDILAATKQVITTLHTDLERVTRDVRGKLEPVFKVNLGAIASNSDRETLYPWKSKITIQSARILALKDKDRK